MSDENATGDGDSSIPDALKRHYQIPALAAVLAFMFWVRTLSAEQFFRNGKVYLSSNDPWYHLREITYIVEHFPRIMPFDPWTSFSTGTSVGQFGTLFDQLIAAAALLVGLGDPSQTTIATVTAYAPAVFGTLVAIPVYFMGKRLYGRPAGLFSAVVLALIPGTFLGRGLVGAADHNIAEPFFQSFAVLGMMVALTVAARERPAWEQFVARDWAGLREVLGWSTLSGVATALYLWTWPPGVLIVGVFGVFLAILLCVQYGRGESPEHAAIVGAVSLGVTTLLSFVPFTVIAFSPVQPSLLQPALTGVVAVGCAFMAWLAREWDARNIGRTLYPVTVAAIIAVGAGVVALGLPDLFSTIVSNVERIIGFGTSGRAATIGEAQPMPMTFEAVFRQYALAFFVAIAAAGLALGRFITKRAGAEELLLVVWLVFMTAAAFTQNRFNYYLAVPVAVFSGYAFGWVINLDFFGELSAPEDLTATHVMVALSVFAIVLAPMLAPVTLGNTTKPTATAVGNSANPGGVLGWDGTLEWMQNETPAEGNYGGAGNADQLDTYGTYERTDDFDYPAGSYGVMSWWDYGHWLTVIGERIPVANPFQQNADVAANYLLASNETEAQDVLAGINEDDAKVRYTAVDFQMITPGSKLFAPTQFYDRGNISVDDLRKRVYVSTGQGQGYRPTRTFVRSQRYYESMMVRLYRYHGSAQSPSTSQGVVVTDWERPSRTVSGREILLADSTNITRTFPNMTAAQEFVEEDQTSQIGGFGNYPSEYVPALEHYRFVRGSSVPAPRDTYINEGLARSSPSWVKLFERVPGATVQGDAPANTTVTAQVRMEVPNLGTGTSFTYTQRAQTGADGEFNMTLPYSTTGYENWGPEQGYTNVSVRANGTYTLRTGLYAGGENGTSISYAAADVAVPESKVIGEDTAPIEVELEEQSAFGGSDSGSGSADTARLEAPAADAAA